MRDRPGPSAYSHSSSLGCLRHGPQTGLTPSHFWEEDKDRTRGTEEYNTHDFEESGDGMSKNTARRSGKTDLQFIHALPRFKGLVVRMGPPALRPVLDEELSASIARKMERMDGKGSRRLRGSMGEEEEGEEPWFICGGWIENDFTVTSLAS